MGYLINIKGAFSSINRAQLRDYVESVVTEAQGGDAPQRVIYHTTSGQSPEERMRQLRALQNPSN